MGSQAPLAVTQVRTTVLHQVHPSRLYNSKRLYGCVENGLGDVVLRQWVSAITYGEATFMHKILFGLAAATLVAVGSLAPAKAQTYGYGSDHSQKPGYGSGYGWQSGYGSGYGYGHQR